MNSIIESKEIRRRIRAELPDLAFRPDATRLFYFFAFLALSLACYVGIASASAASPWQVLFSFSLGFFTAGLLFVGHEVGHGLITNSAAANQLLSLFCFFQACISPTFWKYWHELHHRHNDRLERKFRGLATVDVFKNTPLERFFASFGQEKRGWIGFAHLFFWQSLYFFALQTFLLFKSPLFRRAARARILAEFLSFAATHVALVIYCGPEKIFWLEVVPLLVSNYVTSSYVVTNHNPRLWESEARPLENSCSVGAAPLLEALHLQFGYHVEHHLFPELSPRFAPRVQKILRREFSETYRWLPKSEAIRRIYFANEARESGGKRPATPAVPTLERAHEMARPNTEAPA